MTPRTIVNNLLEDDVDDFMSDLGQTLMPDEAHGQALSFGRTSDTDALAALDPEAAYWYARDIIEGPFPAGEAAIATNPVWACAYATELLDGPFPAGEAAIATDASSAYWYAANALGDRFPAGEAAIAADPLWSREYENFLNML